MNELTIKRSTIWLVKGKASFNRLLKSEVMISTWMWILLVMVLFVIILCVYFLLRRWQSTSNFQKMKLTNARVDEVLDGIDFVRSASLDDDEEDDEEQKQSKNKKSNAGISMQKIGQDEHDIL